MPIKSKSQNRFLHWAEAHDKLPKGTAHRWAEHTKGSIKDLPEHVKKKKHVDKKAFAVAFLEACSRDGLNPEQVVKRASDVAVTLERQVKLANPIPDPTPSGSTIGALGNIMTNGFLLGTVGIPAGLGTLAGATMGAMRNSADAADTPALKQIALARAYRRRAAELKANQNAAAMTKASPGEYVQLG